MIYLPYFLVCLSTVPVCNMGTALRITVARPVNTSIECAMAAQLKAASMVGAVEDGEQVVILCVPVNR